MHNKQCEGMLQNYRSGKLDLGNTIILDEYPEDRVDEQDDTSHKIRRLRQLRCLRREISTISTNKSRVKKELETPFVNNLS